MKLTDKVVLITGASRGIGAEAAGALARRGAHVVLAARNRDLLEENARAIRAAGGRASVMELDVTSDESADRAVSGVLAELGHIDVLVNNAGNGGHHESHRNEGHAEGSRARGSDAQGAAG